MSNYGGKAALILASPDGAADPPSSHRPRVIGTPACCGVAVGVAILFGGGGGVIRQSINFHTASTSKAVMIAATNCRVRLRLL